MIIISDELSINCDIVKECLSEFDNCESREDILSKLTSDKFNYYNKKYMDEFDKIVDDLYESALNNDIGRLVRMLKRISNVSMSIYRTEFAFYNSI